MILIYNFESFKSAVLSEYHKQTGEHLTGRLKDELNILYEEGYQVMEAVWDIRRWAPEGK